MAVAFSPSIDDEEEQKKNAQLSGQSGMMGGAQQQANSSPAGTASGRWTNMMSYVDANKDSDMGNRIEGKLQGDVSGAQSGLSKAVEGVQNYVGENSLQKQGGVASNLLSAPSSVNKADVGKIKSFNGQGFAAGANPFLDQAKQASQNVGKIEQTSSNVGSDENLQSVFGKDDQGKQAQYGQGERGLDSFLLNNAQNGQSAVQKIRDKFKGIGGAAQKNVNDIESNIGKVRQDSEGIQGSFNAASGIAQGNVKKSLDNATQQAQNWNSLQDSTRGTFGVDAKGQNKSQAIMQATGMSQQEVTNFLSNGGNVDELMNRGDVAVADDYLGDEDRANISALQNLGIVDPQSFADRRALQGTSINQAAIQAANKRGADKASIAASQAQYDEQGMGGVVIPAGSQIAVNNELAKQKTASRAADEAYILQGKPIGSMSKQEIDRTIAGMQSGASENYTSDTGTVTGNSKLPSQVKAENDAKAAQLALLRQHLAARRAK
jgi:hypothetical protein